MAELTLDNVTKVFTEDDGNEIVAVDEVSRPLNLMALQTPVDASIAEGVVRRHCHPVIDGPAERPGWSDVKRLSRRREARSGGRLNGEHLSIGFLDELVAGEVRIWWMDRHGAVGRRELLVVAPVPLLDGLWR